MSPNDLNLGVIGNSAISALVNRDGRIVWSCMPRFDGDPIFCSLLDGAGGKGGQEPYGFFDIEVDRYARSEQQYLRNTAILVTTLYDETGAALEITDFCPRFKRQERTFRPMTIVRQIRPVIGHPRIRVRLRPAHSYGAGRPERTRGSNHIRFVMPDLVMRCTTNAPISYLMEEVMFILEEPITMILGPDESLTSPIVATGREFFEQTHSYWREWCRYLSLPFEWQQAVIRAAITLKLSNFEESGGIVAAMTTSIPESADSGRNWDYRFCWLRDANFVIKALNRLGASRTMEDHIHYITNVIASAEDGHLQPVYSITLEPRLIEEEISTLGGYRGMGPVRRGNQAYEHIQNDVYGSVILAATQSFFDERLAQPGGIRLFEQLEQVGRQAIELHDKPDAGLWEYRTIAKVHTFSSVMCWTGCDRLAKIAERLGYTSRAQQWRRDADAIKATIMENGVDEKGNLFVDAFGGGNLDASLLLLHDLGFIEGTDPRFVATVDAIGAQLKEDEFLYRYIAEDDFGKPEVAFTICAFWYVDALAAIGRKEEARDMFEKLLSRRNHLGLLSEDIDPKTGELWGNFPQTYSMVGLINSAMRLSRSWREVQ